MKIFAIILLSGLLTGCASLQEAGKEVWGSSIRHLERARPEGRRETVALSFDACFAKVLDILTADKAKVYLKDKQKRYIAAMGFLGHVDTTEAGIFFTPQGEQATQVEVASMSPRLVESVSDLLFKQLPVKANEKEGVK